MATLQEIFNDVWNSVSNLLKVGQATHDNLNANANLQVGNSDVATGNPVPVAGTAAEGAAVAGNPLVVGIDSGGNARRVSSTYPLPTVLTGSNFEQVPDSAVPSKAVFIGGKGTTNLEALKTMSVMTNSPTANGILATGTIVYDPYNGNYKVLQSVKGVSTGNSGTNILGVGSYGFNNDTHDLWRNNIEGTLLASAARTATVNSADQTNYNAKGVKVFIDVTAITGTPSLTVSIEVKDPISGTYTSVLDSAAISTVSHTILTVHPSITAVANSKADDFVGRTWRVSVTHGTVDSVTYSIGYALNV